MVAFKKFFVMMGLFLLILGAFVVYKESDLATNYDRVPATVTKVEELCYLEKRERGLFGRTTTKTQEGRLRAFKAAICRYIACDRGGGRYAAEPLQGVPIDRFRPRCGHGRPRSNCHQCAKCGPT